MKDYAMRYTKSLNLFQAFLAKKLNEGLTYFTLIQEGKHWFRKPLLFSLQLLCKHLRKRILGEVCLLPNVLVFFFLLRFSFYSIALGLKGLLAVKA